VGKGKGNEFLGLSRLVAIESQCRGAPVKNRERGFDRLCKLRDCGKFQLESLLKELERLFRIPAHLMHKGEG
jgi:hypothetical protein